VERSVAIARKWVNDCVQSHKTCSENTVSELPTRILDLTSRCATSLALIESRDGPTKGCYATLSHCWGAAHFISTKRETLEKHKTSIEWDELPKTFQDAIVVARALGIRFLWIDSLCIVQDDKADWERESRCMATIYSKSFLNIAATGSADSTGGCFSRRHLMHVSPTCSTESFPVEKAYHDDESLIPTIFVRPSFDLVHHRIRHTFELRRFSTRCQGYTAAFKSLGLPGETSRPSNAPFPSFRDDYGMQIRPHL
jgi:hypothetical protein